MATGSMTMTTAGGRAGGRLLLIGVSLGYFMMLLDTTGVTIALPAIRHDLHGGLVGLQWVVNAYTLVFASLLLTMGALADRLGARRVYLAGAWAFAVLSALSAAAPSLTALVGLRALLGVAGAALLPASLALITHAFAAPADRARALGAWASITGLALAAGPVVGGVLVAAVGWRGIFLINVPVALAGVALAARLAGETPRHPRRGLDVAGQLAAILTLAALTYSLIAGGALGWAAPAVRAAIGVAVGGALAFLRIEARGRTPMLPLGLVARPTVAAGLLAGLVINFGLSGALFVLTLFFQQGRGYPTLLAGLAFLPLTIPTAFNPLLTGRLVARVGPRPPMAAGFALAGAGALLLALAAAHASYAVILVGLLLLGCGVSLTIPALIAAVMTAAPMEQAGIAAGALNASRQVGAALGVSVLGAMLGGAGSVVAGARTALLVTGIVLLCGVAISLAGIGRTPVIAPRAPDASGA